MIQDILINLKFYIEMVAILSVLSEVPSNIKSRFSGENISYTSATVLGKKISQPGSCRFLQPSRPFGAISGHLLVYLLSRCMYKYENFQKIFHKSNKMKINFLVIIIHYSILTIIKVTFNFTSL